MAQNILRWMYFLEEWDLHNIAHASGEPFEAIPLLSRRRAIAALRKAASPNLPFAGPARKTLRKLKIKRWVDGTVISNGTCVFKLPPALLLHCRPVALERRERPRRRAAEQRDELAPIHHSITSSARASRVGGTSSPSALAVLRLITSSNLTGAWTGSSLGFAPFRIRST